MRKALIVIDVQHSFTFEPFWPAVSRPDIVERTTQLVEHARRAGDLVIWILHEAPGTGTAFDRANGHVRLMDGLAPVEGEPTLIKTTRNAFTSTGLGRILTQAGVTSIDVCGIQTEQCCETTTRVGADLGYVVTFITDATATFPIEHRDAAPGRPLQDVLADPLTLSTKDVETRTEYALAGRFATISSVEEVRSRSLVAH